MSKLFKAPEMPKIVEPETMPVADSQATDQARKRGVRKQQKQSGFASTILSAGGRETLGG